MSRAIRKDGKTYRVRRGKLVEIPMEWVGHFTTKKTIRERKGRKAMMRRWTGRRISLTEKYGRSDQKEQTDEYSEALVGHSPKRPS